MGRAGLATGGAAGAGAQEAGGSGELAGEGPAGLGEDEDAEGVNGGAWPDVNGEALLPGAASPGGAAVSA